MAVLDRFRPEWKHSDPEVRMDAVRRLGADDHEVLERIAREDEDAGVRRLAIKKLEDPEVLADLAKNEADDGVRQFAGEKAAAAWVALASSETDVESCRAALERLEEQKALALVAKQAHHEALRLAALERTSDSTALADVARRASDPAIRTAATGRVTGRSVLRSIALHDEEEEPALLALERLDEPEALEAIARKGVRKSVRRRAAQKLEELGKGQPTPHKQQRVAQIAVVDKIAAAVDGWDFKRASDQVDEAQAAWSKLGQDADEETRRRFEQALDAFAARRARYGRHADKAEGDDAQAEPRGPGPWQELCERVERFDVTVSTRALEEVRERWKELGPAPESAALEERFASACQAAEEALEKAQLERAASVMMLLEEAERAAELPGLREARRRFDAAAKALGELEAGGPLTEEHQRRRTRAAERLEARQSEAQDQVDKQRDENLARLEAIRSRLEDLAETKDLKTAVNALKEAQIVSRGTGPLPAGVKRSLLKRRLDSAIRTLHVRVQELREQEDWQRWSNEPIREELCKRVEALLEQEDLKKVAAELRELHREWKQAGPVPRESYKPLWERFKKSADEVRSRCDRYFAELTSERKENLKLKLELCEKAEALKDSTDWQATAERLKLLQAEWKKVGPAPREEAEAVWKRFREACDPFFERRKDHLSQLREEWTANLEKKETLCARAEELSDSTAWEETTAELKQLQADWKTLGPVPRAQATAVWRRFKRACDGFFERRSRRHEVEHEQSVARLAELTQQVDALLSPAEGAEPPEPAAVAETVNAAWQEVRRMGSAQSRKAGEPLDRFLQSMERALEAHQDAFRGSELDPEANRKKRLELCERLESLGSKPSGAVSSGSSLQQMVDQLKQALDANALRDRAGSGAADKWRMTVMEYRNIRADWMRSGLIPGPAGQELEERFRRACEAFEQRAPAAADGRRSPQGGRPSQ